MFSPADFAVLLFACADGGALCEPVATSTMSFENEAACIATIDAELERRMDIDAPWIEAECTKIEKIPVALVPHVGENPKQSG